MLNRLRAHAGHAASVRGGLFLGLLSVSLLLVAAKASAQEHWPQFRGPDQKGVAEGSDLPDRWSATDNVAWKADLPGRGWSSPVVWGNRVFLTTVVNLGDSEEPRKGLYFGGNRPDPPESVHQWKVLCLDLESGDVVWEQQVEERAPDSSIHLKNSFASETPVTDGTHVYCVFGNVGIYCLDFDGKIIWSHPLEARPTRFGWGTAASPVLHGDRLYYQNDNEADSYLLALDKRTGDEIWRVEREEGSNWSTPFVWENPVRTEIVTAGTDQVRSYSLSGEVLWTLQGMSSITIATPFEHQGLLIISSGYVLDPARPLYAIRPGAEGDISLNGDETTNEWIAWCQKRGGPYNPTTLGYGDQLFVLYDRGTVASFDAMDGSIQYDRQRLPEGGGFTASPWAYNDRIFAITEDGLTYVLRAGPDYEVLRTNQLADDDMCMSTPAIAGNRLLIRTSSRLYCIQETAAPARE